MKEAVLPNIFEDCGLHNSMVHRSRGSLTIAGVCVTHSRSDF